MAADLSDRFHLEARGLRKSFAGVEVLHGVDLEAVGGRVVALLGENGAGKSTAIKIIAGDYQRDAGEILINGDPATVSAPRDAEALGIRVIYQEFSDAPELSVAENISLGHLPSRWGMVRWSAVHSRAQVVLDQLGVRLPVDRPVGELSIAQRQIVEIARALASDARVLILDEPTSALSADEVDNLFRFIRRLRDQGVAVIYITHRLDEVAQIADDVVVFRDGDVAAHGAASEFGAHDLVEAMVGERLEQQLSELDHRETSGIDDAAAPVLQVRGATLAGLFTDADFQIRPGEIVSLFGRLGCGAVELVEALFGLHQLTAGTMTVAGRDGQPRSPADAIARGIGFVPIDRKTQGILDGLTVSENLSVGTWGQRGLLGLILPRTVAGAYRRWKDQLSIRAPQGPGQLIETLSGGNQQKVVLGRWLESGSQLLVLAEPTRGVDVGARAEIYRVLNELADHGVGLLVVSSDLEEVVRISDRIIVMSRGRLVQEFTRGDVDRLALTHAAGMQEVME